MVHTTAMFSLVTTFTAMYLDLQSISYIDNRGFSGNGSLPPGSLGYQHLIYSKAISLIPHAVFMLNNWLADGLLVRSAFNSITWVSNVVRPSSSIVAASSML